MLDFSLLQQFGNSLQRLFFGLFLVILLVVGSYVNGPALDRTAATASDRCHGFGLEPLLAEVTMVSVQAFEGGFHVGLFVGSFLQGLGGRSLHGRVDAQQGLNVSFDNFAFVHRGCCVGCQLRLELALALFGLAFFLGIVLTILTFAGSSSSVGSRRRNMPITGPLQESLDQFGAVFGFEKG